MKFLFALLLGLSLSALAEDELQLRLDAWQAGFTPTALGVRVQQADALQQFYQQRAFQGLWIVENSLTTQGRRLIEVLQTIDREGLLPADYSAHRLAQAAPDSVAPLSSPVDTELLLSDSFLTLVTHLQGGKVSALQVLSDQLPAPRNLTPALQRLEELAAGAALDDVLNRVRPNQPRYFRLIRALEKLRSFSEHPWPAFALRPSIKANGKDPRLADIAARLVLLGDLSASWQADHLDVELATAVRNFQKRHGLQEDGDIGPETFSALNVTPAERAQQIIVNLERWRWLDSDLGDRFLLVNIAGFDLRLIENNDRIMQQPVIVGRDYRKTPVFSDKVRYLVFNPTWTVPAKLAIQDKLPEIQKNPQYLLDYGFTVYRGGSAEVVDPSTVDWHAVNRKNFNFRLVQAPGPLNALGQVKFMFPNAHDVYLHDTPARELFDKHQRAFSSGCIRVADPMALAVLLLNEEGWTREKIDAIVASGVTTTVHLKKPVPVHIEYWTAWVNSSDTLHFRSDIYRRDPALLQALTQPLISAIDAPGVPSL